VLNELELEDMGVIFRQQLVFRKNHISNVTKTAFFHFRNIAGTSVSDAERLVRAFMTSRLL